MSISKSLKLGKFHKGQDGAIFGNITALGIGTTHVVLEPTMSIDKRPYMKVIADPLNDPYEIGVAFLKEKDGKSYYAVTLESIAFPAPVKAALFPDRKEKDVYNLVWNRPEVTKPQAEESYAERYTGVPLKRGQTADL